MMGVDIALYRCRIGTFTQPRKCVIHLASINLSGIPLCIRLLLFCLLVVNDIERNPGPTTGATGTSRDLPSRRGRRGSRGASTGVSGSPLFQDSSPPGSQQRRSTRYGQNPINNWLHNTKDNVQGDDNNEFDVIGDDVDLKQIIREHIAMSKVSIPSLMSSSKI